MPDQTPPAVSDADVEALIEEISTGIKEDQYVVLYWTHAERLLKVLRDRQSAEARSAAGVEAVLNAALTEISKEIDRVDCPSGTAFSLRSVREAIARLNAPATLASLLAAAFDAGWNCSGEGWNSEYGVTPERFEQMKAACLAQIVPTPPAGGADDAG